MNDKDSLHLSFQELCIKAPVPLQVLHAASKHTEPNLTSYFLFLFKTNISRSSYFSVIKMLGKQVNTKIDTIIHYIYIPTCVHVYSNKTPIEIITDVKKGILITIYPIAIKTLYSRE